MKNEENTPKALVNIEASLTIKGHHDYSHSQKVVLSERAVKDSELTLVDQKKFSLELIKEVYEKTVKSFDLLIEEETPTPKKEDIHPLDDSSDPFESNKNQTPA